ncbi:unnamed protein product [Calypogeia fissa]
MAERVATAESMCQALDPSPVLEPFVDELTEMPEIDISTGRQVTLGAYKIKKKLHRDLPETTLYAYGTSQETASYPGPTLVAKRGIPSHFQWENHIYDRHHFLPVDDSISWAKPKGGGVPLVTHLHGGEVLSESDGHPNCWHTALGDVGSGYTTNNYTYANAQPPAMIWYHDHTVGITRLNMVAGLHGLYLIRSLEEPPNLPSGEFEKFMALQDKYFFKDGSINFPNVGVSPKTHPVWCPEYYCDTILVNGKAWPYLNVYPTKYRFRVLNAANARFFILTLSGEPKLKFIQLGTDQGYLHTNVMRKNLTLAPAQRVDFVIDFSKVKPGCSVVLNNFGDAPYPDGDPSVSPPSTQVVIKFNVMAARENMNVRKFDIPKTLSRKISISTEGAIRKRMNLTESDDDEGNPVGSHLNGHRWSDPLTDISELNSTEIWEIVNLTPDAHPIHIHLVAFIVKSQQAFSTESYEAGNCTLDKEFGDPESSFTEEPQGPNMDHKGWKDTAVVYPGKVTTFVVRWTTQSAEPFSFDATSGPGYVWHCHILDHEDSDMMRPLKVVNPML